MMKFLKFWFPVILYSGIIYFASSIPNIRIPLSGWRLDEIIHVVEYIPFGYLVARAIGGSYFSLSGKIQFFLVLVCTALYGLSDEFHQSLVPGRTSAGSDLLADCLGGALGCLMYRWSAGLKKIQ